MKPLFSFTLFLLFSISIHAQQYHFAYMQTDDKQPFYVRLDDKTLSSSSGGYLVIPKLTAGKYNLMIGFPKNKWPLQNINIEVSDKDLGYLLKNFGDKGWGLFNIQTMDVAYSSGNAAKPQSTETSSGSGFSDILSDVVNSPSIKEKPKEEPVKIAPVAIIVDVTPETKTQQQPQVKSEDENPVTKSEVVTTSETSVKNVSASADHEIRWKQIVKDVKRLSYLSDEQSTVMIYLVNNDESVDTVSVILPPAEAATQPKQPETTVAQTEKTAIAERESKVSAEKVSKAVKKEQPNEPRFIDIDLPNPNNTNQTAEPKKVQTNPVQTEAKRSNQVDSKPLKMINSDCKKLADNGDFLNTRKKMASENNADDMISTAKKQFRQKCYSAEQVKNLAVLFLTDEGKYRLFDTAYPFINDTYNFPGLESELEDDYYKSRFRAMIKK